MQAIETWALTKHYGRQRGCQDINLTVPSGSVFGFLGPNGAGKSTVVKLLTGLLVPTGGGGSIFGQPLGHPEANRLLGFLPEHYRMPDWPSAAELLAYYGRLTGLKGADLGVRCAEVLAQVGLSEAAQRRVGGFSNGMKQRLALGAALLHRPRLLILDEPTAALDPLGRRFVRGLLQDLHRQGVTIFLNSHLLGELEQLCDAVAVIRDGSIVAAGPLAELAGGLVELTVRAAPLDAALLQALGKLGRLQRSSGEEAVLLLDSLEQVPAVAAAVHDGGARLYALSPRTRSLEDLFVELMSAGEVVSGG